MNYVKSPMYALCSLSEDMLEDGTALLFSKPEILALPLLQSIDQLSSDVLPVEIRNEDKVYTKIAVKKPLRDGLKAFRNGIQPKASEISDNLITPEYEALLEKKITIPNFYSFLISTLGCTVERSDESTTTLLFEALTYGLIDLLELGTTLDTPGWSLTKREFGVYALSFADIHIKYSIDIKIGVLIGTNNARNAFVDKDVKDALLDYDLFYDGKKGFD